VTAAPARARADERRLSPGAVRTGGRPGHAPHPGALGDHPLPPDAEYFVGVVILPVILFAMFGLPNTGDVLPAGTTVVAMIFVSFAC
jgi:ABC-2 type transport system permease protein